MKTTNNIVVVVVLALLGVPAWLTAQEEKPPTTWMADFGVRHVWGDVYGRPDLPFKPDIITSKYNEYRDVRSGFFLRRFYLDMPSVLGTNDYINAQSQSAVYKNQSYLATFGKYGRFKAQFRYDEIPHTYSNTTRTLFTQPSPGVLTLPAIVRANLQAASSTGTAAQISNNLPSLVATQLIPGENLFVPQIVRKAGSGLFSYTFSPNWNAWFTFWRENEVGSRPIGFILNSSPSASASSSPGTVPNRQSPGTGVELPEPIDYFNNLLRVGTEYGRNSWGVQLGYTGSFFENNITSVVFDNPFATADVPVQIIPPGGGCTVSAPALNCAIGSVPAHGQANLYPDNHAHYINFAGTFGLGKWVRLMTSINPGWLRQNDPFLPYTANTAITGLSPLPATSLHGDKQTLAMNWTAVTKPIKNVQLSAKYRHYDYNNNTPLLALTPVEGDVIGANTTATRQAAPDVAEAKPFGFNRKTLETSADWLFLPRSGVKVGWEGEWMDRSHRDAEHSRENSVFGTVDFSPHRDLLFRVGVRHQDRTPDLYQDEEAVDPTTGADIVCTSASVVFTAEQRCHRRFDEAARVLNRADALVQYDVGKFSVSGSFVTVQSDFNQRGDTNSPTPLNFLTGSAATTGNYFLYGALKDLSWIYSFDATYAMSPAVSLFAEYAHERYHKRMISRSRTPPTGTQTILTCTGCDTANNDWESTYRDIFDTYSAGVDLYLGKKFYFSPYYSLAAGKGLVNSRALGNPGIATGANRFLLTGTSAAEAYPETTTRIHEVVAVFKYKLRENITPKFEYRYQQFDNRDYQTTPITPYMGCVGAGSVVVSPPCVNVGATVASRFPSAFYPFFVVGDTAAARYLFLGADQPSYRAHYFSATL